MSLSIFIQSFQAFSAYQLLQHFNVMLGLNALIVGMRLMFTIDGEATVFNGELPIDLLVKS